MRRFESHSVEATEALGAALGRLLPPGAIVALDGDLGSGKTAFVRGLAAGLGCPDPVSSPTYAHMHLYGGPRPLAHHDAWRTREAEAFFASGGAEGLAGVDPHGAAAAGDDPPVVAVEWASRVADWLPRPHLWIALEHVMGEPEVRRVGLWVAGEGPEAAPLLRVLGALAAPEGVREGGDPP